MMSNQKSAKMLHTYKSTIQKHTPNAYTPTLIHHIDYLIIPHIPNNTIQLEIIQGGYYTERLIKAHSSLRKVEERN